MAYIESGQFEAACPWMRRSFLIFFNNFGETDDLTLSVYQTLMTVELALGTGVEKVPMDFLPQLLL